MHAELIAEAFGGKGYHVSTPTELESALTGCTGIERPSLIDCELTLQTGWERPPGEAEHYYSDARDHGDG